MSEELETFEKLLTDKDGKFVDYKSDIDEFLGKTMSFLNIQSDEFVEDLTDTFNKTVQLAYQVRGKDVFRIPNTDRQRPINMALMDSLGYLFSKIKDTDNPKGFANSINSLLKDEEYIKSLTQRVDNTVSVLMRFKKIDAILKG